MTVEKTLPHLMNDTIVELTIGTLLREPYLTLGDGIVASLVSAAAARLAKIGGRRGWGTHGAPSARSATNFFAMLLALGTSVCGTSGDALASGGCNAVNGGGFNVSAGDFGNKTVGGFAVGDNVTFVITASSSGSWILRTASFANLDGSPIFATIESQTKSYTVSGDNQDTTLTQYSGGISVTASCTAAATAPTAAVTAPTVTATAPTVAATAPTVTSISPNSGPTAGGTDITIAGTGFTGITSVRFGSNLASYVFNNDSSITVSSPAGDGIVDVTVTTSKGTSAIGVADQFTYAASLGLLSDTILTVLPRADPRRRSSRSRPPQVPSTAVQSPEQTSPALPR